MTRSRHFRLFIALPLALALTALALTWGALIIPKPKYPQITFPPQLFCVLALSGCALFCALGLYYWRRIERLSQLVANSRDKLLNLFSGEQQKLPYWLLAIGAALVLAIACLPALLARLLPPGSGKLMLQDYTALFNTLAVVILVVGLAELLWLIFHTMRSSITEEVETRLVVGRRVGRQDSPQLWQLVDEVIAKAGTVVPDNILLGFDRGLFITQHPLYLNDELEPIQGCTLHLPIPYLAYLTADQAKALIAYQFKQLSEQNTAFSTHLAAIYRTTHQHLYALRKRLPTDTDRNWRILISAAPLRALLQHFLQTLDLAVQPFLQESEQRAARASAALVSAEQVATALITIAALTETIEQVLCEFSLEGGLKEHENCLLEQVFAAVRSAEKLDPCAHLGQFTEILQTLGVTPDDALIEKASRREPSGLLAELGLASKPLSLEKQQSLLEDLEQSHRSMTQQEAVLEIETLYRYLLPAEQTPDLVLRERGWLISCLSLVFPLALLGTLGYQLIQFGTQGFLAYLLERNNLIGIACLLPFVPISALLISINIRHRLHPPLIISKDGVKLRNWPNWLVWEQICDIYFDSSGRTTSNLVLSVSNLPDALKSEWGWGIRVIRKKSMICINGERLRLSLKAALSETIGRYADNAAARSRLAELGIEVAI